MKLLYCPECDDVVRLHRQTRSCECGRVGGKYRDDTVAEVFGDGVPFGIQNQSFLDAVRRRPLEYPGPEFVAFIIPSGTENLVEVDHVGS